MRNKPYAPTLVLDLPDDRGIGREIAQEVFGHSRGTATNYGMPDDDLDVTRDLKKLVRKALADHLLNVDEDDLDVSPHACITPGTIRKVRAQGTRTEVFLQFQEDR